MKSYVYDIEIFPNFFSVVFIDKDIPKSVIDSYVEADINKDIQLKYKILAEQIKPKIYTITESKSDYTLLYDFMNIHKTIIGYNNSNYDNPILDYLIMSKRYYNKKLLHRGTGLTLFEELYRLSQTLIDYGHGYTYSNNNFRYFKRPYYSIDLQKLLYLDRKFVSLKQVAVQLKWYRLQDLPLPFDTYIEKDDIVNIIDYNINDVLITKTLLDNQITEVKLRDNISETYGINVRSESRSGTANRLMNKFYAEATGLTYNDFGYERTERRVIYYKDIIANNISFSSDILKNFLNNLMTKMLYIGSDKLQETVIFNNTAYNIATGGLHSKDVPNIYKTDDEYLIIDADVSSYYPAIILNGKFAPAHLEQSVFLEILEKITSRRLIAKTRAGKLKKLDSNETIDAYLETFQNKADALKIVINSVYGKLGDQNSFLYDLKAMYSVTINGQLYLMMLVDMLASKGIQCISANTDGIVCKVHKDKIEDYYTTCKEWEDKTKFSLEYTNYEKYICYAVNDYIAIKEGFTDSARDSKALHRYVKQKGLFVTDIQIDKGYNKPVVAKALLHYFTNNTPIKEFIINHNDIYDFCISVKTGEDFNKEYHQVINREVTITSLQKNVRYYISKKGGSIMKRYRQPIIDKKGIRREYISLHKSVYSTIFNDFIPKDMSDYNIDYNYYIREANKVIYDIFNVNAKKQKNRSYGGLFGNI